MNVAAYVLSAATPILALWGTQFLGEKWQWINRKIIHLSSLPAIYFFYVGAVSKEVLTLVALAFAVAQLERHMRGPLLGWYQIKGNFGEVYYCLAFAIMPWVVSREMATFAMTVMAVSDAATGVTRFAYFAKKGFDRERRKHWTGSVAFFVATLVVYAVIFGGACPWKALVYSAILTVAEYQKYVDDNIAMPVAVFVLSRILAP